MYCCDCRLREKRLRKRIVWIESEKLKKGQGRSWLKFYGQGSGFFVYESGKMQETGRAAGQVAGQEQGQDTRRETGQDLDGG